MADSNMLKSTMNQSLLVVNTNSLKLKQILSNANDKAKNRNEEGNEPVINSNTSVGVCVKINISMSENFVNEIINNHDNLARVPVGLLVVEKLWDEWNNETNGNPPLK